MTKNVRLLKQTMDRMYLERDEMGDVTFLVAGERIRAHRVMLAMQSPKYKAQFFGLNADENDIYVPNVSAAAFNVFLQLFYKKTIDLTMDNIEAVLDLAEQSLVQEFVDTCVNFLKAQLKANNFCVAYRLANLYDIEQLRAACERYISTNSTAFFASDDFLRCDRDLLMQILNIDTFNCKEIDVLHACLARARVQCKRINLDDAKSDNLRAALGDIIQHIRFASFTAEEFAGFHKSMHGFFTADEVIEILYMIGKLKGFQSQQFNSKQRMLHIQPTKFPSTSAVWSLELDRFAHKKPSMGIDVANVEPFSFCCSDPIRLHGIAMCISFNDTDLMKFPKTLTVRAISDQSTANNRITVPFTAIKYKVYRNQARTCETLIIFEEPIERVIEFTCFIQPPFKQCNYEFELHSTIHTDNVAFQFKDSKWVKRLFFDKYDDA